MSKDM